MPSSSSSSRQGITHDEARSLMSGGPLLSELVDNSQILSSTQSTTRKEVFTSLFFLIADSRSVFTSGVRHDSADAMTLLTQILNPRGVFARSAVAVELCTFIASMGLSGLRRLRLDRHVLSNKEGVAPAAVAFIMALSIAASELNTNTLLNGNTEAEMRLRAMTSSYSRGGVTNDSSPNLAQSFGSPTTASNANNNTTTGSSPNSSSPTTNAVSTVQQPASSNIENDPLLRRDLQSHETARPHRTHRPPQQPQVTSNGTRLSRYHNLPPVPAGQQMPGSNPAYVRGSTEVTIHLTAAGVPSAVKSHARAFGLGGRSAIPKLTQGADLEKRSCLPLKLIFPGLNDESSSSYRAPPSNGAGDDHDDDDERNASQKNSSRKQRLNNNNNNKKEEGGVKSTKKSTRGASPRKRRLGSRKNSVEEQEDHDGSMMVSSTSFASSPLSAAAATVPMPSPSAYKRHRDPNALNNNKHNNNNDDPEEEDIEQREQRISEVARELDIGQDETVARRRKLKEERERESAMNDDDYQEQQQRNVNNNHDDEDDDDDDGLLSRVRREQAKRLAEQQQKQRQNDNDDDDDSGRRHNVRPLMKVDRDEAQEASREAEEATQKGNQNTTTTIASLSTTPSLTPDTRSRTNSTFNSPPRNPAVAKQQQQETSAAAAAATASSPSQKTAPPPPLSTSAVSGNNKSLIVLEDDDDDDDLNILQKHKKKQASNDEKKSPKKKKKTATRTLTLVEKFLVSTSSTSSSSSKVIPEAAPTSITMGFHTPTSTYPLCSYKVIFSPLKRRGAVAPTFRIVSGHRHNIFVVGTGDSQKFDPLSMKQHKRSSSSSPTSTSLQPSSNAAASSSSSQTNINNSMIACSGDNSFSQCSGSPITFIEKPATSSSSRPSNQQQQQTVTTQLLDNASLHLNRQFVSVGVSGKAQFTQVVAGAFFTACVTTNGEVYLWGDNYYGQCSVGNSLAKKGPLQETPNKVLFRGNRVTRISCGATFVIALTEGDRVLGWGSVHLLGIGTGAETVPCEKCLIGSNVPHGTTSSSSTADGAIQYTRNTASTLSTTSSAHHSEVSLASNATASQQQNQNNNITHQQPSSSSFYLPIENEMQKELISSVSTVPCSIAGLCGKQITCIASGNFHSIAVTKTGAVYSWGFGGHGQLGIGTQTNASVPKKLDPAHFQPMQVESVYCGSNHSAAVAKGGFALWLWGDNRHGQCGVSSFDQVLKDEAEDFLGSTSNNRTNVENNSNNNKTVGNNNNNSSSSSSSSSSLKAKDACVLVPTRVPLNFKQLRASIITVALGTNRTCILFSDGDVAIFGCQIPFSSFSGGGNCSGAASGTGCHGVFATPCLLCPQLAICQLSARHDHVSITACKRDIAVITIGLLPGGFDFGCRIEFLTKSVGDDQDDEDDDAYSYNPSLAPYCNELLCSSKPIFRDDSSSAAAAAIMSSSVTISNNSFDDKSNTRFIPTPSQRCTGNPLCVAVGGSHTLIGTGFFSNNNNNSQNGSSLNNTVSSTSPSSQQQQQNGSFNSRVSERSTTSGENNNQIRLTNHSSSSAASYNNNNNSSSNNSIFRDSSCVVSYGSGTWGQLGLGQHVWKHISSSSAPPFSPNAATPPSPLSASTATASPTTATAPSPLLSSNIPILVKHPAPVFFTTAKETSSPYLHRNSSSQSPFNTPNTSERAGSIATTTGSYSSQNNNNNSNSNNRHQSGGGRTTTTTGSSSSSPSSSLSKSPNSPGGVKLTLRSLVSGHAFCFAIFSAPTSTTPTTTNQNQSIKHPTITPHHKVQQQEDTIIYFWGNNNHHQSGVPPTPPPNTKLPPQTPTNNNNNNSNESISSLQQQQQQTVCTKYDSPVLVPSLSGKGVVQIACGSFFALALTADGNVYAWGLFDCCGLGQFSEFNAEEARKKRMLQKHSPGSNNQNQNSNNTNNNNETQIIAQSLTKEQRNCVCIPLKITDMIFPDEGITSNSNKPTMSSTPASSSSATNHNLIVRVAAGPWHCAVLSRRGQVYTWGFGTNHRLGLGLGLGGGVSSSSEDPFRTRLRPTRVIDLPVRVRDISCGHANTLAISAADSSLYVWGDNEHGQCGVPPSPRTSSLSDDGNNNTSTNTKPNTLVVIPTPKKVISNGVRSAAITRTCCIAVMWNGAVMISGVLEDSNSSSPSSFPTSTTTTKSFSINISSKNCFTSIQSAISAAAKKKGISALDSSLKAQPGVAVGLATELFSLFPAPPPTSAFLDDDDDDDDDNEVKQQNEKSSKKSSPTSPRPSASSTINSKNQNKNKTPSADFISSIEEELGKLKNDKDENENNDNAEDDDDEEIETRTFHAMDVVASLQHACLVVEVNRPGSSEWNNLRKAMQTSVVMND